MILLRESDLINSVVWPKIWSLYKASYLPHAYLIYDLVYEYNRTKVLLSYADGEIKSYILLWENEDQLAIHLWGKEYERLLRHELLERTLKEGYRSAIFQIHEAIDVNSVVNFVKALDLNGYQVKVEEFYDMGVTEENFQPYKPSISTKLNYKNEEHVKDFIKLKRVQGRQLDKLKAREMIRKYLYHGVFVSNELVSIACAYIRLRDLWIIGDVFTHPDYRDRGYAKAVTSAVTQKAVDASGRAFLHVRINNLPAIKVYTKLGYELLGKKTWIFMQKEKQG